MVFGNVNGWVKMRMQNENAKIAGVLEQYQEYIDMQQEFDIVYSKKYGYILVEVHNGVIVTMPELIKTVENLYELLLTSAVTLLKK